MAVDERIVELLSEWGARRAQGEETSVEDLCRDAPDLVETLRFALRRGPAGLEGRGESAAFDPEADIDVPGPPDGPTAVAERGPDTWGFVRGGEDTLPDHGEIGQLGPYRVMKLLGAGGMGAVFQAIDDTLERQVALKVLRPSLAHDERARLRFVREARAAAALEHDHIVTIFQVGEDRGIPYLAMPLLLGTSLEARLAREGRLPIPEVLRIGREIAEGLDAAHGHKVIHRDIKPANIWLEGTRGRVKILDFGLARATDEAQRLTQEDAIIGTPAYMAPEQAIGSKEIDARLDLFSLGSVLYRMATGRVPFAAQGALQTLVALVQSSPQPPRERNPEIPPALDALILKLLAKDPADRPPSARAVVEAIEAIEHPPAAAAAVATVEAMPLIRLDAPEDRPRPAARPKRAGLVGRVAVGAAVLGLLGLGVLALPLVVGVLEDKGRLTLESPLPYVLVAVRQSDQQVAVLNPGGRSTVALWPGAYDLALEGDHEGLTLAADRITIRRGEWQVIKVVPRPSTAAGAGAPAFVVPAALAPSDLPGLLTGPSPPGEPRRRQVETRSPRGVVRSLAWSSDRKRLACVAGRERVVRIYDAETLELTGLLAGHSAPILSVAWSPTGLQLATAGLDGTLRLWGTDGAPGHAFRWPSPGPGKGQGPSPGAGPLCVAWSPGGRWLAVGGTDRKVRILNSNGASGPVLDGHGASISALSWSPDGRHLAAGTSRGALQLWDADGTRGPSLEGDAHPVLAVSWSADGRRVAAGGPNGARVWSADGAPGPSLEDAPAGIACLAWNPRTPTLAAACSDGTVRLWNEEGQPGPILSAAPMPGNAAGPGPVLGTGTNPEAAGVVSLAWSPDGLRLASAGQDGGFRLWEADGTPGPALVAPLGPSRTLSWSPDGRRLVADSSLERGARIWDVEDGRGTLLRVAGDGREAIVNAVAWSPDGRRVAAGDAGRDVRLWEADGTPGRVFEERGGTITSLSWSPDGARLAAGGSDDTLHLIAVEKDDDRVLKGHTAHVLCVAWSPDGRRIASGGYDCTIRVWSADDRTSAVLGKLGQRVAGLSWSPGGTRLASAGHDATVQVWDVPGAGSYGVKAGAGAGTSGTPLLFKGHAGPVQAVCWGPDGSRLASGGVDGTVRFWSAEGTPGPVLDIGGAPVAALAFSPDGRRLAAAGEDGVLRIWDAASLAIERVIVPTAPGRAAVLDGRGRVVRAADGAAAGLVTYQVASRGIVTPSSLTAPPDTAASKTARAKAKAKAKNKNRTKKKAKPQAEPKIDADAHVDVDVDVVSLRD